MNLNIGSSDKKIPGFMNVDIRNIPGVDIVDDVSVLSKIESESVQKIIARNILEHFAPDKTYGIVELWVSKLVPSGTIEISVPDGEKIFERYNAGIVTRPEYNEQPWMDVVHSIFGNMKLEREWHGNEAEKYMHHNLFNEKYLAMVMMNAGLHKIYAIQAHHSDNLALVGEKK